LDPLLPKAADEKQQEDHFKGSSNQESPTYVIVAKVIVSMVEGEEQEIATVES
jgi:hypothetical protein